MYKGFITRKRIGPIIPQNIPLITCCKRQFETIPYSLYAYLHNNTIEIQALIQKKKISLVYELSLTEWKLLVKDKKIFIETCIFPSLKMDNSKGVYRLSLEKTYHESPTSDSFYPVVTNTVPSVPQHALFFTKFYLSDAPFYISIEQSETGLLITSQHSSEKYFLKLYLKTLLPNQISPVLLNKISMDILQRLTIDPASPFRLSLGPPVPIHSQDFFNISNTPCLVTTFKLASSYTILLCDLSSQETIKSSLSALDTLHSHLTSLLTNHDF